jgi:3-methyladenine DNA glycosylase/8-oxoguanine DNA glycosylase
LQNSAILLCPTLEIKRQQGLPNEIRFWQGTRLQIQIMEIRIPAPVDFSFRRTVLSHGWCALKPFEFDKTRWTLMRVLDLPGAKPVTVTISATNTRLRIVPSRRLGKRSADKVLRDVSHMFRLDEDFDPFYEAVSADPDFQWIRHEGAGRLLRSPTVFEDLVKMICTTNCSWALTEKMTSALVDELGNQSDEGRKSFPTAEVMAGQSLNFFRDKIRAGYRAPYLKELAQRVAAGALDVESWLQADLPHKEFVKELKSVKGVGDYAAENLLKLLGRYDGLALDSWTRAQFNKKRNNGRAASDKKILRFYARFNSFRGLALWCDMTRHWLDPETLGQW